MFDPLSALKSTLVIHSPLFSTTNRLLQVPTHVFELITISPYWKVRFMNTEYQELQRARAYGMSQTFARISETINLGKPFFPISRIWNISQTWFLARVFVYLSFFISQILVLLYWMVCIFIFHCMTVQAKNYNSHTSNKEGLKNVPVRQSCFLLLESPWMLLHRQDHHPKGAQTTWSVALVMQTWYFLLFDSGRAVYKFSTKCCRDKSITTFTDSLNFIRLLRVVITPSITSESNSR